MGGGASIPGNAASSRDIASQVSELGEAYEPYANKIEADGIDRYSSHPDTPPTPCLYDSSSFTFLSVKFFSAPFFRQFPWKTSLAYSLSSTSAL